MDFFEYANIASLFTNTFWVQLLIGGLCFALVFVFQGIALYTIASRYGYKNKWMAFLPFFNTYYIGVCAQKNKFYNVDAKKLAMSAGIIECVLFAAYIVYYSACFLVLEYEVEYITTNSLGISYPSYELRNYPAELNWAAWMYNYMDKYILSTSNLVLIILEICVLMCFFQTYASRRYVLFTVTSILFPIQGILFFVVRNNKGVNYRQYVAAVQAQQYRMYQQQQQYYNQNPYNRQPRDNGNPYQNPYSQQGNSRSGTKPDDPFGDFGSDNGGNGANGGSPFDEFDN